MSFLGIAFLFALPLAALPILLHFMDRRRKVEIEWGAIQFLQTAATTQTQARRLKEWLLLLLRVAAIAALVFSLARPLVSGRWFGASPRTETVLIIDNSLSTTRNEAISGSAGGPLFDSMRAQAMQKIESLSDGDAVRILVASPRPVWLTQGAVRINSQVREELLANVADVQPTLDDSDLLGAFLTVVQTDADLMLQQRDIVMMTDGMAANWDTNDQRGWARMTELLSECEVPTQIQLVGMDQTTVSSNLAVNEVRSQHTVTGIGQTITLSALVQNYSPRDSKVTSADWLSDGKVIDSITVPVIESQAKQTFDLEHSFDQRGHYRIGFRINSDVRVEQASERSGIQQSVTTLTSGGTHADTLLGDNESTCIVSAVDRVPILIVEYGEGFTEADQDAYFTQAALGWNNDGLMQDAHGIHWKSVYQPRLINAAQLATTELSEYHAVVIPSIQSMSDKSVEQLNAFVESGGGVWIGLGPRTDIAWFNDRFYKEGAGLSPVKLGEVIYRTQGQSPMTINPYLGNHPATVQLVDTERLDTADVQVMSRVQFDEETLSEDVSVLLGLSNGKPLVVEGSGKKGRVIVQGIPLRQQWSDLVRSQAFVVMVQDWLSYLTQPRATNFNLVPGQPIALRVSNAAAESATLRTPASDEIDLTGLPDGDDVSFHTTRTDAPGLYELEVGLSGESTPFFVQRSNVESDLTPLSNQQRQLIAERLGLNQENAPSLAWLERASRFGRCY